MSNREALRKLSSKVPSPPEIEEIMDALMAEGDLAAAITGAAIAEAWLERLLISRFKSRNANLIGQLFKNRGPLMDFHAKILIAQAFGLITSPMAEEFHSIKAIRNAFAHSKVPLDFGNEIIGREIRSMKMGAAIRKASEGHQVPMTDLTNRQWFQLSVRILLILLYEIHKGIDDATTTLELALTKPDGPQPSQGK